MRIAMFEAVIEQLTQIGAFPAVQHIRNEIRKVSRGQRDMGREGAGVCRALAHQRNEEEVRQRRAKSIAEANALTQNCASPQKQIQEATELLKKKKLEAMNHESLLEARYAMR